MGKTITLLSILLIFTFTQLSNTQATTISIRLGPTTGQDAYTVTNDAGNPWPHHPDFATFAWTNGGEFLIGRCMLKFDLTAIPTTAIISNARLSLYGNPAPANNSHSGFNKSYLRRITTPWDENTVTWNDPPDFSTVNQATLEQSTSPMQDYPNIDVTNLVRDMVSDPSTNYGLILMLRTEALYRCLNFASSECADVSKRPLLEITFDEPSPVELTSFTSIGNGRNVTLNWTTAKELNNSGFDVQRFSVKDNSDWVSLAFIHGNGNSTTQNNYSFEDRNLSSGIYSYRLKQIDYNGAFEFHNLSNEVSIGVPSKFSLSQNYPNPFNPSTKINYDIPQDGKVVLKVYDINGRELQTIVNEFKTAGYYTQDFNAGNLSSGSYFVKLESGGEVISSKMMLVK